jgi:hypothetical protein
VIAPGFAADYYGCIAHMLASKRFGDRILIPNNPMTGGSILRKLGFLVVVLSFFALASLASAQQFDPMFGFSAVTSPGAAECGTSTSGQFACPEKGGIYPSVGADVIFAKRLGFGFDAVWRGGQGNYGNLGVPYRPILFDFNAVYQPRISKKAGFDLMGGVGWQDTRYYSYSYSGNCVYFGACYNSSNHFLVDVGAGVRYYVWNHVFVRPEVRFYDIINNTVDFTSGNIIRLGASIGYTIGPD